MARPLQTGDCLTVLQRAIQPDGFFVRAVIAWTDARVSDSHKDLA
jgi:hypothetical protein